MFKDSFKDFFRKYLIPAFILTAGCFSAQKKDTLDIYKKIRKTAYKHKISILLYHTVFVDPAPENYDRKPLSDKQKTEDPNLKYKGKIIRKIDIQVYDPFGYSVNDTTRKKLNPFQKMANGYHIKTRSRIIRNLLLFRKNEAADPVVISESERLIRAMGYVNDARIYLERGDSTGDSVDVKVIVKDKWTLDAPFTITQSSANVTLIDRNIFGTGQSYQQYLGYALNSGYDYRGNYQVTNIKNSYISSSLYYSATKISSQEGFSFDRPFYSALAKWAGGISGSKTETSCTLNDASIGQEEKYKLNFYNYDVWFAKSFRLPAKKMQNKRFSDLILAVRNAGTQYQYHPPFSVDVNKLYAGSSLYIGSAAFSLNKYYKDQFIYRFGANEDIPEGTIVQLLYGLSNKDGTGVRYYSGFEISNGKHFNKFGYLSADIAYGAFFNKSVPANSTLNTGLVYFSDLFQKGKWYLRQFVYYKFILGAHKDPTEKISISQNEMYGFNSGALNGTGKMVLNLETVIYCPYNIVGFRFAPVTLIGFGSVEEQEKAWRKSRIYQAYAIGLLIRNENLLTSSFQISIGAYPYLPGENKSAFKMNPVTSFTLKVRNFAVPKPAPVSFQ